MLCVLVLPNGDIVSGSGDTTIRVWSGTGACMHTIRGHTDTVRQVAMLSLCKTVCVKLHAKVRCGCVAAQAITNKVHLA